MGRGRNKRWFAVGHSGAEDSRRAGAEAAAASGAPGDPKLLITIPSCEYDLSPLLAGFHNQTLVVLAVA
jgi:hypothetical protein